MFAEINTALRWEHGEGPRGLVIVTEATPADATFMLLHFVGMYATDGTRRLCFVELRRTLESLAPLAKKLGITVRSEIENQGIVVVASPIVSDAETFELRVDVAALERELACAFERATAEQRALCIVLDDLSALLNVAATPLEVVHLLQRLQARMAGSKHLLVALMPEVIDDPWYTLLKHQSDLAICIRALETGYSKDVDGVMLFTQPQLAALPSIGAVVAPAAPWRMPSRLHYTVGDSSVRVFIPGASA